MSRPAHAELSGSTAFRWIRCQGSINLIRAVREGGGGSGSSNAAAREGTFAHAVAAHILNGNEVDIDEPFTFDDHGEEFSWPIPTDMLEHVDVYVDRVRRHAAGNGHLLLVEHHVDLSFVRDGMFGTCDAGIVKYDTLVVNDFKYGHVPVRLIDYDLVLESSVGELGHINPQLLYYAAGLAHEYRWSHREIILEITQPRCVEVPPVQSTTVSASALKSWAENDLWEAAHLATVENAPLSAGEWCRFCPALGVCPEAEKTVREEASADFAEVANAVTLEVPTDAERLSRILRWAPYIDAWIRACEASAFWQMRSGTAIDGFKLVEKKTHRVWPTQDAVELAKMLKVKKTDLFGEPEMLSPAKMEKIAGKKIVKAVAVHPAGDLTIAALSDRRPAVEPAGDFDDVANDPTADDNHLDNLEK